jgi:hypothetical protein
MFKYLLYTLLLEMPVVLICYRRQWKTVLPVGILVNFFTWPLITILYNNTSIHLLILEAGVFVVEAIAFGIFFTGSWKKALLVSFAANGLSLLVGVIISGINFY